MLAMVQLRHDAEGRTYYRRKLAQGKTALRISLFPDPPPPALRLPTTRFRTIASPDPNRVRRRQLAKATSPPVDTEGCLPDFHRGPRTPAAKQATNAVATAKFKRSGAHSSQVASAGTCGPRGGSVV
jgi:hypothetical protein